MSHYDVSETGTSIRNVKEENFIFCCGYIPIVFVNASSRRIKCMRERDCSVTSIPTIEWNQAS